VRVNHHLSVDLEELQIASFMGAGIDIEQYKISDSAPFAAVDIFEDDPRWPRVKGLIEPLDVLDVESTVFDVEEIVSAEYCTADRRWEWGYPQPENSYKETTYSSENQCRSCGMGLVQKAPFRMVGEPRWAENSMLCLHWVSDEIFVAEPVWREVFEPFGIASRQVLDYRSGKPLQTCVQLDLKELIGLEIPPNHGFQICEDCGQPKWDIFRKGFFPRPKMSPSAHIFKSTQFFGADSYAYRHILVSRDLMGEIWRRRLKGIDFAPCESGK